MEAWVVEGLGARAVVEGLGNNPVTKEASTDTENR